MATLEERIEAARRQRADTAEPESQGGLATFVQGMANEFMGALQGTSPVVRNIRGEANYTRLGPLSEADWGPIYTTDDGKWIDVDPMQHVVLIDPANGKPTVYLRSPETDERLLAAARLITFGALAQPVTRLPGGVTQARPTSLLQKFEQTGVEPNLPAVTDNRAVQIAANTAKEVFPASEVIEAGGNKMLNQTATAAERIAAATGQATTRQAGGEAVIRGAETFKGFVVSDDIALPADAITAIIATPTRNLATPQGAGFALKSKALFQRVDKFFAPTDVVRVDATMDALAGSAQRFDLAALGEQFTSPRFQRWAKIIEENGGSLTYNDLRLFRTEVGRLLRSPQTLMQADLDTDGLKALYGALSDDLLTFAATKGPEAVKAIQEADNYYRAGADRIRNTLGAILKPNASGEATFDLLVRKAGDRAGASLNELQAIRRSIPDEEWNEIAAAVMREMGRPTASAVDRLADANFSVSTWLTNFERLSDGGKDILFGGREGLRQELDVLADVVAAQKRTLRLMNTSGTGRVTLTGALWILTALDPVTGLAVGGSSYIGARLLMSPRFVKWLHSAPTTAFGSKAWTQHAAQLRVIASQEEALRPAINSLTAHLTAKGLDLPEPTLEERMERFRNK